MQSAEVKAAGAQPVASVKPFQIRGRFVTAVSLRLEGEPDSNFFSALDIQLQKTPHFFLNAPFVIDLEQTAGAARGGELETLVKELRGRNLSVFAIQNGSEDQTIAAKKAGLIALPGGRDVPVERVERNITEPKPRAQTTSAPVLTNQTITEPVRSGQTVVAEQGDLIVVGPVSSGAELVAVGNIHVYGSLRGRALAGVNGDESARIFCQNLDAELLAIAGVYQTSEDLDSALRKQRVHAFLADEKLCVEALK
ncbi:septum site-determining protein MinC [Qingshengfaniella alkalisoli]|uniref:Probable septum site-determining protein MinC n=1 Tax=Qingshengfaniella alkalisoli TaxID=2599296 RepID=A0A5B8JBY4_9RHOB|nr:septum site-determining protein MinC [Qingshengfaniella alkalisoli]QDY71610.1 septum formation inhibitor MinC [Qingshengfaniella alkalisoli]